MDRRDSCLVRYGLLGRVGWFQLPDSTDIVFQRGEPVVIRTLRGDELGEILLVSNIGLAESGVSSQTETGTEFVPIGSVLRRATHEDQATPLEFDELRHVRFEACQRLLEEGQWPVELLDVELLLDGRSTVFHLLGAPGFDRTSLHAYLRKKIDFDIWLEDIAEAEAIAAGEPPVRASTCGSSGGGCGQGGCSSGCGSSSSSSETEGTSQAVPATSGCAGCGIQALRKRSQSTASPHSTAAISVDQSQPEPQSA
jgi:hypothetical protein